MRRLATIGFMLLCGGCRDGGCASRSGLAALAGEAASLTPSAEAKEAGLVVFEGTCDASGAVPLDARRFAVADDENNVIRIYDAERGGPPVYSVDLSPELDLGGDRKQKRKKKSHDAPAPEVDLEAATRLGDRAVWLSSHARNKKGKVKDERLRFFATTLPTAGSEVRLTSPANGTLLEDLIADPRFAPLGLAAAAERGPGEPGGLNLEGLTATPEGALLIGFRNPVPGGRALLVPLLEPERALRGEPARFGEPLLLDLGGLSVRGLSHWRGRYLIAAGHYASGDRSTLFEWRGPGTEPRELRGAVPPGFNAEALFTPEERDDFLLLSDDGARTVAGERCKKLDDPTQQRFRGVWRRIEPG